MMNLCKITEQILHTYFTDSYDQYKDELSFLDTDCVLFGTGQTEICRGREAFQELLEKIREKSRYVTFHIENFWCEECQINDSASMVYGGAFIWWDMPREQEQIRLELDSRFTCIYRKVENHWKLLHVHHSIPQEFSTDEICGQALSAQMKRIQKRITELRNLAERDSLTNLIHLRTLEEIYRARNQENGWIVVIDVDDFKKLNDTYGHLAGNCILKGIAEKLQGCVREEDAVARIGGDEFAILFGKMPLKTIQDRLNSIVKKMEKEKWTLSMGAAKIHQGEILDLALKRADMIMYQVKNNGKNSYKITTQ